MIENKVKNRFSLLGLLLVFLSPILFAVYFSYFSSDERELKNKGNLIAPIRTMPEKISLHDVYDHVSKPLRGKWNLVFLNKGLCENTCRENLYKIRQIRLAMGKHDHRVQRVVLMDRLEEAIYKPAFTEEYRGQMILSVQDFGVDIVNLFKLETEEDPFEKNRIYIIDPIGNLMMSYEGDADPLGIIKDLKVLIKASRIG